jgi:hypothetical protein
MSENTESPKVYKIPSDNLGVLAEKFKKLARRAKKLGLPIPTYTEVGEPIRRQKKDPYTDMVTKTWLEHQIVVDPGCTEVKVQGWTFIATIQHTEEGNIIRAVGNAEVPTQYRNVSQLCEHCNTNRNRKDTYILKHEGGETKQVGRNCLADFFGHDALMYAERAQYLADIDSLGESMEDDFGFGGGGGPKYEPLEEYLAYVAECIKLDGWMSRGKAKELDLVGSATCEVAYKHLHRQLAGQHFKFLFQTPTLESVEVSNNAIEWASEIEGEEIPEYLHNIRIIARRGVYEGRDMGLAASIVAAYQRHLSTLRWKELQAKRAEIAQWVGKEGDRIRVKLIIEKVVQCDSMYGTSHLHIMSDENGNVFVWFSSAGAYETGKEIILQGTIKKHNERDGVKQNMLTRCTEVEMKNYYTFVAGEIHKFTAATENEVKKLLREKLGLKKLPNGTRIIEDVPQEVSDERVAV